MSRQRLDQVLVARELVPSRARARDAIARGCVTVGGAVVTKPGQMVDAQAQITIDDPATGYVARSALKLVAALDAFGVDPAGTLTLDVGQSTGGFTQVLLERGAAHVTGADVGHDQLHARLRNDTRVTCCEGINARDAAALPAGPFDLIVIDVSFISLMLVLPAVVTVLAPAGQIVALFKPQFEVGRDALGKGGLVTNPSAVETAMAALRENLPGLGLREAASIRSPIEGGDGNVEHLVHLVRAG